MEERCAFLEEEIPQTEEQLGVYVSASETQRLVAELDEQRAALTALTTEWEDLTMQLETQATQNM